ncbi:hypothetical protein HOD75_04695 [archaeon]|jgi:hypothetical protein|nr:hypothetical protein [archaeon]MBT4242163.1 hypothetical protein [archaeon]MBT4417851.1 hypothetical protein [archaeon]
MDELGFAISIADEHGINSTDEFALLLEKTLQSPRYDGFRHFDPIEDTDDFQSDLDEVIIKTPSGARLSKQDIADRLVHLEAGNPQQVEAVKAWEYLMAYTCRYRGF